MATETPSVAPPRAEVPMVDAEVVRQIRELHRGGWGAKRIAREFEVARNTVRRSLRLRTVEAGIQIRPRARTRTEGCIRFGTVSPGGDDRHVCLDYEIPILGQRSFLPQDLASEGLVGLEPHTPL